jgi:hypothetical protein
MKLVTTVGTSLFENYLDDKKYKSQDRNQDCVDIYKQIRDAEPSFDKWKDYHKKDILPFKKNWKSSEQSDASAEIASILKILEESEVKSAEIYLLATDTVLSVLACELIKEWFSNKNPSSKISAIKFERPETKEDLEKSSFVIQNLRISNNTEYEQGFMRLIEVLDDLDLNENDALNITGGYKAIIPIMTIYGQLKNVPLKYIYDESELGKADLIEVGSLPINFDWGMVELLKPLLGREFLNQEICKFLGQNYIEGKLEFKNNSFQARNEAVECQNTLIEFNKERVNTSNLQVSLYLLWKYKLIYWNKKDRILSQTALGKMIKNYDPFTETGKGLVMEHLLYKYFHTHSSNSERTKEYKLNIEELALPKKYEVDGENIELGDIDIALNRNNTFVWGESKAFYKASSYGSNQSKLDKYYKQLRARSMACLGKVEKLEVLLIVFKFDISGIQRSFDNPNFITALKKFRLLESEVDLQDKVRFRCLGISIKSDISKNENLNITESFYKADYKDWNWEELNPVIELN